VAQYYQWMRLPDADTGFGVADQQRSSTGA